MFFVCFLLSVNCKLSKIYIRDSLMMLWVVLVLGRQVDGSVVTWGDPSSGGKSSKVAEQLKAGVTSAAWQPNLCVSFLWEKV